MTVTATTLSTTTTTTTAGTATEALATTTKQATAAGADTTVASATDNPMSDDPGADNTTALGSEESSGIAVGAVVGIAIPLVLVIGAIVWWFQCGPAAAVARRTAAWKTERAQQEDCRNTIEMEMNPLVVRQRAAAAAAAATSAAAAATFPVPDYMEPAVVGADYEYGSVTVGGNGGADYMEPAVVGADYEYGSVTVGGNGGADYMEPAVVGADYEYGPAEADTNVQDHLYVDPNACDMPTADAVLDESNL
jgi:hypothetical protein